jgi:predicted ribosome-associated RNA-binding protein Tma20
MAVFLNEDRFVSALEQMTCPLMTFIEKLCINPVQLPHAQGKITIWRLDQEVIVVVHHAVGMAEPVIPLINMLESVQEVDAVLVVFENGLLFISAGGDVIDGTGVFYAERAGNEGNLANNKENVKL